VADVVPKLPPETEGKGEIILALKLPGIAA